MSGILEAGSGNQALTSSHFNVLTGHLTNEHPGGYNMPGQNGTTETDEHTTATTTVNCSINRKTIILRLREFCHRVGRWKQRWEQIDRAEVWLKSFLTTEPDGGTWSGSRAGRLTPGKEPRYLLNRSLGGPQKDVLEKRKIVYPWRGSHPSTTSP